MFKDKLRWIDVKSIGLFALAFPLAAVTKIFSKECWLFSERPDEARDNGYWLFRYLCEHEKQCNCFYVIRHGSTDEKKVASVGKTIRFGTLKHYIAYLVAEKHISSQVDGGMPNMRVCGFLERSGLVKNKKVFLQHGITKDTISFGFYNVSRADLFVCATQREAAFVERTFGYPEGAVQELGFARFDNLFDCSDKGRLIVVMPTWRAWLARELQNNDRQTAKSKFLQSKYYRRWSSLLHSDSLHKLLKKHGYRLLFYPHSDMQPYVDVFHTSNDLVRIAEDTRYDVQELLKSARVLITDYSSVAFDFAYMNKPMAYYHFDYEEYRAGQHPKGYFQYERDGFGPVYKTEEELLAYLEKIMETDARNEDIFTKRAEDFFDLRDRNNCRRIAKAIEML